MYSGTNPRHPLLMTEFPQPLASWVINFKEEFVSSYQHGDSLVSAEPFSGNVMLPTKLLLFPESSSRGTTGQPVHRTSTHSTFSCGDFSRARCTLPILPPSLSWRETLGGWWQPWPLLWSWEPWEMSTKGAGRTLWWWKAEESFGINSVWRSQATNENIQPFSEVQQGSNRWGD